MIERLDFGAGAAYDPDELGIHVARYSLVNGLCRGRRVLDIACGAGFGSHLMVERWGATSVDAVDVSAEALESARALFDRPEITWHQMDANVLDPTQLPGPFDLIVCFETIEHLDNPEGFLRALKALSRPETSILISCPNDHWYYGPGRSKNVWHKQTYSLEEFRALTEGVLGPATCYFLGSTVGGFVNVRLSPERALPVTLLDGLRRLEDRAAVVVPGTTAVEPTAARSLYFTGVWGPAGGEESAVVVATSPEHRPGIEHLRLRFVREDRARPRVVLVADIPGWAYDNIAQHIRRQLDDVLDISIVYAGEYEDWVACIHDVVDVRQADLAHFFWREYLFAILGGDPAKQVLERYGVPERDFSRLFLRLALTTSVYDHLYLDPVSIEARTPLLGYVDAYSVSSEKLQDAYRAGYPDAPDVVIEDGVDLGTFRPAREGERPDADGTIVIGWAGNSNWHRTDTWDPKGLHTILKPAIEQLRVEGFPVRGHFVDSSERVRPRDEMPQFYREIDVYVCVSEIEGTPNPVLEAMASGVSVVSTDVGIVGQVFGSQQRRFILSERTVDALVTALRTLVQDAELRAQLAAENLVSIGAWSWAHLMPKWLQLFKVAGERRRSRLRFAAAHTELAHHLLHDARERLVRAEQLVEEQREQVTDMDATIADQARIVREQREWARRIEGELEHARSLRGVAERAIDWCRPLVGPLVAALYAIVLLLVSHSSPATLGAVAGPAGPAEGVPGALAHALTGYGVRLGLHAAGTFALFSVVRELFGGRGALLGLLWLGSCAGYLSAITMHASAGPLIVAALAVLYCLTRMSRRRSWRATAVVGGAATTAMVSTDVLTAIWLPAFAVYFIVLNRRYERHALGPIVAVSVVGAAGYACLRALVQTVSEEPVTLTGATDPGAGVVVPLAAALGCGLYVIMRGAGVSSGETAVRWNDSGAGFNATLLAALYLCVALGALLLHWVGQSALAARYETLVLIPALAVVVGGFFARILIDLPRVHYAGLVLGAMVLFALPWVAPVSGPLRAAADVSGHPVLLLGGLLFLSGAAVWLRRANVVAVLLLCLCASAANVAVATDPRIGRSLYVERTGSALSMSSSLRRPGR